MLEKSLLDLLDADLIDTPDDTVYPVFVAFFSKGSDRSWVQPRTGRLFDESDEDRPYPVPFYLEHLPYAGFFRDGMWLPDEGKRRKICVWSEII